MRQPKLDRCPVCDTELKTEGESVYGPGPSRQQTVQPECEKGDFFKTELPTIGHLHWRCKVCGATWRHSSYEDEPTVIINELDSEIKKYPAVFTEALEEAFGLGKRYIQVLERQEPVKKEN